MADREPSSEMEDSKIFLRIHSIIDRLDHLYSIGNPVIGDEEYDLLTQRLNIKKKISDSGSGIKIKHPIKVQSIKGYSDFEKVKKWCNKHPGCILQPKIDGVNLTCTIKNGIVSQLITRGDGVYGYDKMNMFKELKGLNFKSDGHLKLECYIKKGKQKGFSSERSRVAGIINRLDGKGREDLRLIILDVYGDLKDKFLPIKKVPEMIYKGEKSLSIMRKISESGDYPVDGLVVKSLTSQSGNATYRLDAIAWKFYEPWGRGEIIDCTWQVGRTGQITPVIQTKPILIDGRKISKITIHNLGFLKEKQPLLGSTALVKMAGMIIPYLSSVEGDGVEIKIPLICPSCNSNLHKTEETLHCNNSECPGRFLSYLDFVLSKNCFNIKGLTGSRIMAVYSGEKNERGFLSSMLSGGIISMIGLISGKTGKNMLSSLKEFKPVKHRLIISLNIKGISIAKATDMAMDEWPDSKLVEIVKKMMNDRFIKSWSRKIDLVSSLADIVQQ